MRCYIHPDTDAVAICKCCNKGACIACAQPVTNGIACSDACRPTAEDLSQLQITSLRNIGVYRMQRFIMPLMAFALFAMGAWNAWQYPKWSFGWIIGALGLALLIVDRRSSRRRRAP